MNTGKLQILKEKLNKIDVSKSEYSQGVVTFFADGILVASGLKDARLGEIVKVYEAEENSKNYTPALVLNLGSDEVGLILLEENLKIKTGSKVVTTSELFQIETSNSYLGRVIDILGNPLDGKGEVIHKESKLQLVEKKAKGVITRKSVNVPLQTGIISVDALIPVGRGQRELIIGDRQTGKTTLVQDIIINQAKINSLIENKNIEGKKVYCIYVAIGQKRFNIAQFVKTLSEHDALKDTIILAASASDQATSQYLAPYVGTAIGEFFMERGDDALIIYDDLTKHAKAYRQISLLLRRPPGREAYPGDVFYLHSRLLERSGSLNEDNGGGSLTALPIIETQAGDVSAYIPTNVISITDGQIYLKSELYNSGFKPAVDVGISVSRVGGSAQIKAMKQVAGQLKLNLAQFRELLTFSQFGVDVDPSTQRKIDLGKRLNEILKQGIHEVLQVSVQIILLYAVTKGFANSISVDNVSKWAKELIVYIEDFGSSLVAKINAEKKLTEDIEKELIEFLEEYNIQSTLTEVKE